jgi:hypothetical protein
MANPNHCSSCGRFLRKDMSQARSEDGTVYRKWECTNPKCEGEVWREEE